ncbi:MAG: hypothetical protein RL417_1573 [Pseudomonadota bacterium]
MRSGFIFSLVVVTCVAGCGVGKSFTKPRSDVRAEAERQGVPLPSSEEERELFLSFERTQQERLLSLIRNRAAGPARDSSYRIGAGDEVEINVFDVPELNVTVRVRESGFMSLPLIGPVKAAGLSEPELLEELSGRLTAFVRQPQVSVFISNYGSQKVAVMGAVRNPGTYPLKKGSNSLLELISEAGGVSDKAGNFVNFIPAEFSGVSAGNEVEARARLTLASQDVDSLKKSAVEMYLDHVMGTNGGIPLEIPVRGGDMIIVPESGKVTVEGEVEKGGALDLGRQMTLLSALAAAGGITYGAKVDEVEVVRDVGAPDKKARLVIDLERISRGEDRDVRLRNGDIVRVPSDSGRRLTQDTFEGISRILNFGVGGTVNVVN